MELVHDIWEWVIAVFEHWHGYVSGGILAFALEYGEKLWDWKPSKKWIVIILCIGFLFSMFSAWREQHLARIEAEKKLESMKNPDFEITAGTSAILKGTAQYTKLTEARTFVVLPVTVFNHGAPSVIRDIQMTIRFPDGEELKGKQYLPKTSEVSFPGPKGDISFSTSSSLFIKATTPIPTGGQADGFVMYEFPDGLMEKIFKTADWMELTVFDVNNKPFPLRMPRSSTSGAEFGMTPGMIGRH